MGFGITPIEMLDYAKKDLAELKADPLELRKAMHCVTTLNHLPEHVWETHKGTPRVHGYTKKDYRNYVKSLCPELQTIQDLCNFAKHVAITLYVPQTDSISKRRRIDVHELVFAKHGIPTKRNPGLGIKSAAILTKPMLVIQFKDGSTENALDLIEKAFEFWAQMFASEAL
jgi:hypothetical protein